MWYMHGITTIHCLQAKKGTGSVGSPFAHLPTSSTARHNDTIKSRSMGGRTEPPPRSPRYPIKHGWALIVNCKGIWHPPCQWLPTAGTPHGHNTSRSHTSIAKSVLASMTEDMCSISYISVSDCILNLGSWWIRIPYCSASTPRWSLLARCTME